MEPRTLEESIADLAKTLGLERNLLEYLLYKLVAARLLMVGNDSRYIMQSLVEVEDALDRVRDVGARRQRQLIRIGTDLGIEPMALTIDRLGEMARPATRFMLYELKHDYVRLAHQIDQLSRDNKRLADLALGTTTEALKNLAGAPSGLTYDEHGGSHHVQPRPVSLDEVI